MALYLVQHGRSLSKQEDPEQGLSPDGIDEVVRIAEVARQYGVPVTEIKHSGKKRARQTAEIFAQELNPAQGIEYMEGLKPMDDVVPVARELSSDRNWMLVGHLPFMERLTTFLLTGITDRPLFKFQNGGIVCLDDVPDSGGWVIRWALMPRIGRL